MSNEQSAFFRDILDNLPQCIFWKSIDSKFLGCNAAFASRVGLKLPDHVVGLTDYDLPWPLNESSKYRGDDQEIIESRRPRLFYEEVQTQSDGSQRVMLVSKVPVFYHEDKAGIVCIYHDITDQKILERSLADAVEAAELASKAKSDFIANMSHDFRVPMSGVLGMLEALSHAAGCFKVDVMQSGVGLEELKMLCMNFASKVIEYTNIATGSGKQLTQLFDDILESTELESGAIKDRPEEFSVKLLVEKKVTLMAILAKKKGLELNATFTDQVPETIAGYPHLLGRVLLNLLANALKFTHFGRVDVEVDVECAQLGESKKGCSYLLISVTDTGVGIAKENFSRIFENFTRLSPSYSGVYQGHGLGLFAVKGYIDIMQGEISVESELGEGSCFRVRLPLGHMEQDNAFEHVVAEDDLRQGGGQVDAIQVSSDNIASDMASQKKAISILLVEDNPAASLAIQLLLKSLNYQVHAEATGLGAVEAASSTLYDLVLLDIGLPDITGIDVAKRIRALDDQRLSSIPIIALTGHAGGDQSDNCISAGICEVLTKPADPLLISAALKKWLE